MSPKEMHKHIDMAQPRRIGVLRRAIQSDRAQLCFVTLFYSGDHLPQRGRASECRMNLKAVWANVLELLLQILQRFFRFVFCKIEKCFCDSNDDPAV